MADANDTASEIWRPAPGFEHAYEVSNLGAVRRGFRNLVTFVERNGYVRVNVYIAGKMHRVSVHRLVAVAFHGPVPQGKQVNHRNGIKADNRAENLEYLTASENRRHSFRVLGQKPSGGITKKFGESNPVAVLTDVQVIEIRRLTALHNTPQRVIGEQFGVSQSLVSMIHRRKVWPHL